MRQISSASGPNWFGFVSWPFFAFYPGQIDDWMRPRNLDCVTFCARSFIFCFALGFCSLESIDIINRPHTDFSNEVE